MSNKRIATIRETLKKAQEALNGTEINMSNYGEDEVAKLNHASTVAWWAIRDTLGALDEIRAEALKDAADRAIKWFNDDISEIGDDDLRAAIYAGEVK